MEKEKDQTENVPKQPEKQPEKPPEHVEKKKDKEHVSFHELEAKVKNLEAELAKATKLAEELNTKSAQYLSTASYYKNQADETKRDFERFKERNKNIEADANAKANEMVIKKLLPVIDDFDHAISSVSEDVMKGFVMIYSSLTSILKDFGAVEIVCKNEPLNPEKHNCIETVETDDASLDGKIAKVYQKGYMFAGTEKTIRPATVSVYKANL